MKATVDIFEKITLYDFRVEFSLAGKFMLGSVINTSRFANSDI